MTVIPSLADVAVRLGVPVFPCNGEKQPIVAGGFKAAETDPTAIRRAFNSADAAMIGVPTGRASGWVVVDIDIKGGALGDDWLQANAQRLPQTRTHKTRSGGLHLIFRAPEVEIRNSASRVAPGVDVRGTGGYVIVPPSPGYQIADHADPAPMPEWLIAACLPAPAPKPEPYTGTRERISDRYASSALDGECRELAAAREGTRNHQLNVSAVKLGGLVAAGALSRSTVEAELTRAALAAGLDRIETAKTIASGLGYGMQTPRQAPERAQPLRMEAPRKVDQNPTGAHLREDGQPSEDRPALPLIWFDDIEPVLDCADFVQGVLIEGSAAVVYGESNAGKTFWTTDLALHVSAGMEWNGRRVEQGGVVYCVLEGGFGFGFRNRVAAWRKHHARDGEELPFAAIPASLNLLNPEADTPRLIETIKGAAERMAMPVKLIVIDTLARAFAGGNENSSEDMGALVLNMDAIRAATGACVLFVHHSGKDQAKGARGHSSLRAALDTEIEVKADEESGIKTATTVKQRETKKGDVFAFTLDAVELGKNRHGEGVTTCIVKPADADKIPDRGDRLSEDQQMAFRILADMLADPKTGQVGSPGVPKGLSSVPEAWWRDRFYQRAKPGAGDAAKQKAFRRAADKLLKTNKVGMDNGRVWLV